MAALKFPLVGRLYFHLRKEEPQIREAHTGGGTDTMRRRRIGRRGSASYRQSGEDLKIDLEGQGSYMKNGPKARGTDRGSAPDLIIPGRARSGVSPSLRNMR